MMKHIYLLLFAAALLAGCNKELSDPTQPVSRATLGFSEVAVQHAAAPAATHAAAPAHTRASEGYSDYTGDLRINLIPVNGVYDEVVNRRFTHTSEGWKGVDESSGAAPVWLTADTTSFFAWTPASIKLNEVMPYPYNTSVTLAPAIATPENDLAYATATQVSAQNPFAELKLRRAYAKITLKTQVDASYPGTPKFTKLAIGGITDIEIYLDLSTGQTMLADKRDQPPFDATAGLVSGEIPAEGVPVLAPPRSRGITIDCTVDGREFTGLETELNNLSAGKNYVVTLRISTLGITMNVTTADWNGGSTAGGELEEYSFVRANSAMVKPGGGVSFDIADRVAKAKTASPALDLSSSWVLGTEYTPLLIWQDVPGLVGLLDYDQMHGYLTVITDDAKGSGNAVVGLFPSGTTDPAAGTCIWSWHVWVSDYKPDGTVDYGLGANQKAVVDGGEVHTYGTIYMNSVAAVQPAKASRVIMDRNLGATAALYDLVTTNAANYPTYGLYYEGGRKDPFPKAEMGGLRNGSISRQDTYNASGAVTGYPILDGIDVSPDVEAKNPHILYSNWLPSVTSASYASWGDGTTKSVYDPCPEGWRVPPDGIWDDFGASWAPPVSKNAGWGGLNADLAGGLYSAGEVKAFYPAAGSISVNMNTSYDIGNVGCLWTSKIVGNVIYHFMLRNDWLYTFRDDSSERSNARSVRCIQE